MFTVSPKALHLEELEQEELEEIINRHSTPQQIAQRAKIVVLASQGYSQAMIAREFRYQPQKCPIVARKMGIGTEKRHRRVGLFERCRAFGYTADIRA